MREQLLRDAAELVRRHGGNLSAAAKAAGISRATLWNRHQEAKRKGLAGKHPERPRKPSPEAEGARVEGGTDACLLTLKSRTVRTLDAALAEGHVDLTRWKVDRWILNKWDLAAKIATPADGVTGEELAATELWQVKVWFKAREAKELAAASILDLIRENSPVALSLPRVRHPEGSRRMLEVSIMDPHVGLRCFRPAADHDWDLETCGRMAMAMIDGIVARASGFGPFEKILFPFGNDYLHVDNVFHTTTAGTAQPEADSWHHVYLYGERLAVAMVDRLKEVAPVEVLVVPGNHDRQSTFTLGRLLSAYYRNDADVTVDSGPSPYKFCHYGVNLIGFEHGHSIQAQRLAALMANEMPEAWAATKGGFREWHLGDQHRKASAKPITFEEAGCSIEYLPSLTGGNEWHRLKGYNHNKRGATGFVWDHDHGQIARLSMNVNTVNGRAYAA